MMYRALCFYRLKPNFTTSSKEEELANDEMINNGWQWKPINQSASSRCSTEEAAFISKHPRHALDR
jgi:hypothetical protein